MAEQILFPSITDFFTSPLLHKSFISPKPTPFSFYITNFQDRSRTISFNFEYRRRTIGIILLRCSHYVQHYYGLLVTFQRMPCFRGKARKVLLLVLIVVRILDLKSCGTSSSGISQISQEREELREELSKLREERAQERQEFTRMKEEMDMKVKQVNELIDMFGHPQPSPGFASCSAHTPQDEIGEMNTSCTAMNAHHASPQTLTSSMGGVTVSLFCAGIPKEVVATGLLISKDAEEKVGGEPLGPDYVKIYVEKVRDLGYKLPRPFSKVTTIGQAIKHFVAWPMANVLEH